MESLSQQTHMQVVGLAQTMTLRKQVLKSLTPGENREVIKEEAALHCDLQTPEPDTRLLFMQVGGG